MDIQNLIALYQQQQQTLRELKDSDITPVYGASICQYSVKRGKKQYHYLRVEFSTKKSPIHLGTPSNPQVAAWEASIVHGRLLQKTKRSLTAIALLYKRQTGQEIEVALMSEDGAIAA
jgi:hypothetical protein